MKSNALSSWDSFQTEPQSAEAYAGKFPIPGHSRAHADSEGFSAEAVGILEDVRRAMERHPEGARAAALRLVTLLTPPSETETVGARGGLAPWQKRKVDRYMREHLEHPLRLGTLAEQIPLSLSHFCRAFAKTFGDTPHVHIVRLRLELAQKLMLTTQDPLSQIALACGLADQAHLSKLFRRWIGETPSAWRRQRLSGTARRI